MKRMSKFKIYSLAEDKKLPQIYKHTKKEIYLLNSILTYVIDTTFTHFKMLHVVRIDMVCRQETRYPLKFVWISSLTKLLDHLYFLVRACSVAIHGKINIMCL